jgi:hypothetical protein
MLKRIINLFKTDKKIDKQPLNKKESKNQSIDELFESIAKETGLRRDGSDKMCTVTENENGFNIYFNKKYGLVDGEYYATYVDKIKQLKKEKKHTEAISLLLKILDAVERESKEFNDGVAPWYYEQLAIIYRKEKRIADEIKILKRYAAQKKSPGVGKKKLADRLVKAKAIYSKT